MTLQEIINDLDKSKRNECDVDMAIVSDACGLLWDFSEHDDSKNIKSYYFAAWQCTDTWVGGKVYFMDDKAVCISWRNTRSDSEQFSWVSTKAYQEVYDHILELIRPKEYDLSNIDVVNMSDDLGKGFHVDFAKDLLSKNVYYIPTKEYVMIAGIVPDNFKDTTYCLSTEVTIKLKDGSTKDVPTTDILSLYRTKTWLDVHAYLESLSTKTA